MKNNKKQYNFRFHSETMRQIEFLAKSLERDKTDIIELAVNYLCETYREITKSENVPYGYDIFASSVIRRLESKEE